MDDLALDGTVPENFGGLQAEYSSFEASSIVVLPVPYDGTSTWGKGSDKGPGAIIEASGNMELYDLETGTEPCLKGIFTDKPVLEKRSPEKMVEAVRKRVSFHLQNKKFVVTVGGEHSVGLGSIRAHASFFKNLCVLQLDAHSDLRQEYLGSKFNHACTTARTKEICRVEQVGVRSMDSEEKPFLEKENVFFAKGLQANTRWFEKVVSRLKKNVYVSIDLDVFDPGIMPATGTPEPGGLQWYPVLELLKRVVEKRNLVGFDVTELSPIKGLNAPNFLAAKLIYTILAYRSGK